MSIPLPRHTIVGLEPVLDGSQWRRWVDAGRVFPLGDTSVPAAVRYLRLKPTDSCRLTVFEPSSESSSPPRAIYLQLFADRDRARTAFDKEQSRRHATSEGFEPFFCEESAAIGLPFPNDPDLPDLRHVFDPDRYRRSIGEVLPHFDPDEWRIKRRALASEVLAYKPGRRCVLATSVQLRAKEGSERRDLRLHVQVESAPGALESFESAHRLSLAASGTGLAVPRPYGVIRERGLIASEWCDGENLIALGRRREIGRSTFEATGRALAILHGLSVELAHLPSPIERVDRLSPLADDLVALIPTETATIRRIEERLIELTPPLALEPSCVVHGDFHLGQVIVRDGEPVLVDFDRAGRGYAVDDLGEFIASITEHEGSSESVDAFVRGYGDHAEVPDAGLLRPAIAHAQLRRAMVPFRRLQREWPARVRRRLARVEQTLERGIS